MSNLPLWLMCTCLNSMPAAACDVPLHPQLSICFSANTSSSIRTSRASCQGGITLFIVTQDKDQIDQQAPGDDATNMQDGNDDQEDRPATQQHNAPWDVLRLSSGSTSSQPAPQPASRFAPAQPCLTINIKQPACLKVPACHVIWGQGI